MEPTEDVSSKEEATSVRAKNEALLTGGMGYGNKKKASLEAFWSIIVPGLLNVGWKVIAGEGEKRGCMLFVPPNVDTKTGKRNVDYYDRIKILIDRIEERRNSEEAKLADTYREKTRDDQNVEFSIDGETTIARPRRGPGRPPKLRTSLPPRNVRVVDISWKDGGTTYPKRSSQVGDEYQVSIIPPAGSYTNKEETTEPRYDIVWDCGQAASNRVVDYLDDKVPSNKREKALEAFHNCEYSLENTSGILAKIHPTDCSDWTEEEREVFRTEIFRKRKDFKALCSAMRKEMGDIMSYYLGTYKKSDGYRLLKTVLIEEKIEKARSSLHHIDQCAICEDGGSLLICDGCESEWHMTCTRPVLKVVPEGHWECDVCVDRKFLDARRQVIRIMGLNSANGGKRKADAIEEDAAANDIDPKTKIVEAVKAFSESLDAIFAPVCSQSGKSSQE